ncbi:Sec-independent protein translocase protein TatB [Salinicola peritrichatus]|uniref:Sec-independent protein translocase protein TatB n=1 Tax=Salinicola peritrichatus TaxID=1267424 RepID=UPI000DA1F467|nr:Sec-independent protein translocase protein TatB [Salinicola peritrichatus]
MFDIGFFELLLIGIVGLLVLGPERLPKAARTAGLWIGRVKRSVSSIQREITAQLEAEELRQKLAEQQKKLDEGVNRVRRDVENSFNDSSPPPASSEPPRDDTPSHDDRPAGVPDVPSRRPDADASSVDKDSNAR